MTHPMEADEGLTTDDPGNPCAVCYQSPHNRETHRTMWRSAIAAAMREHGCAGDEALSMEGFEPETRALILAFVSEVGDREPVGASTMSSDAPACDCGHDHETHEMARGGFCTNVRCDCLIYRPEPVSDAGPREPRVSTEWLHDVENRRGLVIEQRTARMLVLDLRDERERTAQLQGDLYRIVRALDIGARTYSGHEAMDKDILPAIAQLQSEVTRLRAVAGYLLEDIEKTINWRNAKGMRPATDTSVFANVPPSGLNAIRRALKPFGAGAALSGEAPRCICSDMGPSSYEGYLEDCPVHGREAVVSGEDEVRA